MNQLINENYEYSLEDNPNGRSFTIFPTTPYEINNIISNLKPQNTTGYDNINQKIATKCSSIIPKAL